MHPAISVIFFTVTSGAGFGFLALIGLGVPLPVTTIGVFLVCAIASGLSVAGLISSTLHLGHPERAWRAFSQWRSSWLSREGVAAVVTLLIFGVYALVWLFTGQRIGWLGLILTAAAVTTIFTTAMIYAQLKTIPHWNNWMTPVCYLMFAFSSGVLIAATFGSWKSFGAYPVASIALAASLVAWTMKALWWRNAGRASLKNRGSDTSTATGLGGSGTVRLLERPHSGENYLTREMVHKIGRRHALKLRVIAVLLGGLVPILICLFMLLASSNHLLYGLAALALLAGLFVERWLFFAEAEHSVSLYY